MKKHEIKKETDLLIEDLPDETTWDDLNVEDLCQTKD